jgi:tripartite ATP-independent transporter DctP family solute receptor
MKRANMLHRIIILALIALFAVTFAVMAEGKQEAEDGSEFEKRTMRIGLISADGHPVTQACKRMSEIVKEKTDGQVTIEVVAGGALGGEVELQDMVSLGSLEMCSIGTGIPPSYNPEFNILNMPYLWESQQQMIDFANSDIQEEMNEKYRKASGIKIIASNWDQGIRHTLAKKPIRKPEDFDGVKIRVPQLPAWVDMWKAIGANPTPIPFPEVYTALQQGVVDAMECPLYWIYASSFYEQAKYLILTGHVMYYNQIMINDDLFQGFSPELQTILEEAAFEAGEYETKLTREQAAELRSKLEDEGTEFLEIDRDAVSEMITPVYDKWEDKFGSEIREKIEKFKANWEG